MTEDTPEDSTARVRRSGGIADQSNGRVREATTAHALLPPPCATVAVTPPPRQDVELSWPAGDNDEDYCRVASHVGIHRAELLIFRREPEGQVRDRARRAALCAGADRAAYDLRAVIPARAPPPRPWWSR